MTDQQTHWQNRYAQGDTPWDSGRPCEELCRVLDVLQLAPGPVLEIGCGTGTNTIELARRGFEVTAIDIAPLAVQAARAKAAAAGVSATIQQADALNWTPPRTFSFIFDRGTYHVLRRVNVAAYLAMLRAACAPGGQYLTLCGSTQGPEPAEQGPPRVSARDLVGELGLIFELTHLREFHFERAPQGDEPPRFLAWSALWRRPL